MDNLCTGQGPGGAVGDRLSTAPSGDIDDRLAERVWQRVSPSLNPYPEARLENQGGATVASQTAVAPQAAVGSRPSTVPAAVPSANSRLPANPCCMGTAALADIDVVAGFVEDELAMGRTLLRLASRPARRTPNQQTVRALREMAAARSANARRLAAAYYLITGQQLPLGRRYAGTVQIPAPAPTVGWAAGLREAYHEAACAGFNYRRAADATADECLQRLFRDLGEASYGQAERLMDLLARGVR